MQGATRLARRSRRGMVLPIALLCCLLITGNVVTFQFVSSSDYAQVRTLSRSIQAGALADLASDELWLLLARRGTAGWSERPGWLRQLLERVDRERDSPGPDGTIDVVDTIELKDEMTETAAAALDAGTGIELSSARARIGPFRPPPESSERLPFYAEPLFGDASKDLQPADLRAPLAFDVSIATGSGAFRRRQELRAQELALTDTAPIAQEFALFSFRPPRDDDSILNELQRGGRFQVYAKGARAMVRGPLFLVPEESGAQRVMLGGVARTGLSLSYPEAGNRTWLGWSVVPGPRALQYPIKALNHIGVLNKLESFLRQSPPSPDVGPRRPIRTRCRGMDIGIPGALGFGPWSWHIPASPVVQVGMDALAAFYWPLGDDSVAYFQPGNYFHALRPEGSQTFSLLGGTEAVSLRSGEPTSLSLFSGLRSQAPGGAAESFRTTALLPSGGPDGDLLVPEPMSESSRDEVGDIGIVALHGVANFDSHEFLGVDLVNLFSYLVLGSLAGPGGAGASKIVLEVLDYLGLKPTIKLLLRWYGVDSSELAAGEVERDALEKLLKEEKVQAVPYGLYCAHDDFWSSTRLRKYVEDLVVHMAVSAISKVMMDHWFGAKDPMTKAQKLDSGKPGAAATAIDTRTFLHGHARGFLERYRQVKGLATQHEAYRAFIKKAIPATSRWGVRQGDFLVHRALGPRGKLDTGREQAGAELLDNATAPRLPPDAYPKGYLPPKLRRFEAIATRRYPDLQAYLDAESVEGVLQLRGAVILDRLDYHGPPIAYRGRGIVIASTADAARPATLDAEVFPVVSADASNDLLILAHCVTPELLAAGRLPALRLGRYIAGSVYSQTGVAPAQSETLIEGNLVTGWLNKSAVDGSLVGPMQGVKVIYARRLGRQPGDSRAAYWSVELAGRLQSTSAKP